MHARELATSWARVDSRLASNMGSDTPHAPPMRSHSRRSMPSQSRVGESNRESMCLGSRSRDWSGMDSQPAW